MTDMLIEADKNSLSKPADGIRARWLVRNLMLYLGLLVLGVANFTFHAHYPLIIAWLPPGLAVAAILLYGPRVLPGVILGMVSILLATAGNATAAIVFGLANGAACAVAWGLSRLGKWSDFQHQTVSNMARMLLIGCVPYALMAFMLGPYAISNLIKHDHADNGISSVVTAPSKHGAANHAATGHAGHTQGKVEQEPPLVLDERAAFSSQHTHVDKNNSHSSGESSLLENILIDAIGVLLIAPAIFYFKAVNGNPAKSRAEDYRGAFCTLAMLIGVTVAIYSGYLEQNFGIIHTTLLVLPPAVWLALKYDLGYTLLGNIVVLFIIGIGTSLWYGPFNDHSSGLPLLTLISR
jgi:integral membrane sensor domain MASE1